MYYYLFITTFYLFIYNTYLQKVSCTMCSRGPGLRPWIMQVPSWPAVNNLSKRFSKVFAQKRVQNGIDATVRVSENVAGDLCGYRKVRNWIHIQRLAKEYQLKRETNFHHLILFSDSQT